MSGHAGVSSSRFYLPSVLFRLTTKSEPSGVADREKHASNVPASSLRIGVIRTDTARI